MVRMLRVPQPLVIIKAVPESRANDPAVPLWEHGPGFAVDEVGGHGYGRAEAVGDGYAAAHVGDEGLTWSD